jgi:hypothetical protein
MQMPVECERKETQIQHQMLVCISAVIVITRPKKIGEKCYKSTKPKMVLVLEPLVALL